MTEIEIEIATKRPRDGLVQVMTKRLRECGVAEKVISLLPEKFWLYELLLWVANSTKGEPCVVAETLTGEQIGVVSLKRFELAGRQGGIVDGLFDLLPHG